LPLGSLKSLRALGDQSRLQLQDTLKKLPKSGGLR
jgi:hypothetical protein